jgi:hypothetical protein
VRAAMRRGGSCSQVVVPWETQTLASSFGFGFSTRCAFRSSPTEMIRLSAAAQARIPVTKAQQTFGALYLIVRPSEGWPTLKCTDSLCQPHTKLAVSQFQLPSSKMQEGEGNKMEPLSYMKKCTHTHTQRVSDTGLCVRLNS